MSNTESENVGHEIFEIDMNSQKVIATFIPNADGPFKKSDTGIVLLTSGGMPIGSYPYTKTSFAPLPNPFMPK